MDAVDGTYSLLTTATNAPLSGTTSADLPPDWVRVDRKTGAISADTSTTTSSHTTNFGYDAMRVVLNIALDKEWNNDARATGYLQSLSFLDNEWQKNGTLMATYTHAGSSTADGTYETPAMYGATIGYFETIHPDIAPLVYRTKLEALFDSDSNTWREELSYYDDNIAWFGIALYNHLLPNLVANYPATALRPL